jgi:hypothetical protein
MAMIAAPAKSDAKNRANKIVFHAFMKRDKVAKLRKADNPILTVPPRADKGITGIPT